MQQKVLDSGSKVVLVWQCWWG